MRDKRDSIAKILASFGKCYDEAHLIWLEQQELPSDHRELLTSPMNSLCFFASYVHERSGRSPQFSLYHRIAIKKVYGKGLGVMSFNFADSVWNEFEKLTPYDEKEKNRHKTNEKLTKGPVKEVLIKLKKNGEANLIKYLTGMPLKEAYRFLIEIKGIGHKLASLFLRDVWSYIKKWPDTPQNDEKFLQPRDIWLQRLSKEAFPNIRNWPQDEIEFAEKLVKLCKGEAIDPVEFNKGAWFVGSHFKGLCIFSKVPEVERVDSNDRINIDKINNFDVDAVRNALKAFRDHEMKAFWV